MSALLAVTFGDPFVDIAAINDDWPTTFPDVTTGTLEGRARWAASYWNAANILHGTRDVTDFITFAGPIMQNAGLACELVLKCFLLGNGYADKRVRNIGHSLLKLYEESEKHLDAFRFETSVAKTATMYDLPDEIAERAAQDDVPIREAELGWRNLKNHIRLLDGQYDKPFKARYIEEGPVSLPEPYILLLGSLILLNAMNERLDLPLVGTKEV